MKEDRPPTYYEVTGVIPPIPSAPTEDSCARPTAPSSYQTELSASFPPLSMENIKDSCHLYATAHCCYGSSFIDTMHMTSIANKVAYVYTLESFGEKRETALRISPYYGRCEDGVQNAQSPQPWNIPVTPTRYFFNHNKSVEIPNTAYATTCTNCEGKGTNKCIWCWGLGGKGCLICMFDESKRPCTSCRFSNRTCMFCDGRGKNTCEHCDGRGKRRACKMLIVTWTNHAEHFITDTTNLPSEKILEAEGKVLFTEEKDKLLPICDAADVSVNVGSTDLINRHRTCFESELIIKQKHVLRAVPYTYITYQWKNHGGEFYVYGLKKKAYFDNYPESCCCGCSIM